MATTTNYGWTTPDDTALVKDGAAAIRTLGSSVDTTTKNLNPSTTLGDIEYRSSTANTNTRLGIGSTGQVLTVSGGVPAWSSISAGGFTVLASGSLPSSNELSLTSISSSYKNLQLVVRNLTISTQNNVYVRFNTATGGYQNISAYNPGAGLSTATTSSFDPYYFTMKAGVGYGTLLVNVYDYADTTGYKIFDGQAAIYNSSNQDANAYAYGILRETNAISTIKVYMASGTFTAGTYVLYGVK
jgi:hypothetical protein